MSGLSAEEIAAMRDEAERDREPPAAQPKKKRKKRKRDRVTIEELPDGGLMKIVPTPGWRDREGWFALLVMATILALPMTGAYRGNTGALVALVISVALCVLLFATAPTWHVRWTNAGDMIVYKRFPRRPKWVGRCGALEIETTITMKKKKFLGWLKFSPTNSAKHFFPLTADDVQRMLDAAQRAGFKRKNTTW